MISPFRIGLVCLVIGLVLWLAFSPNASDRRRAEISNLLDGPTIGVLSKSQREKYRFKFNELASLAGLDIPVVLDEPFQKNKLNVFSTDHSAFKTTRNTIGNATYDPRLDAIFIDRNLFNPPKVFHHYAYIEIVKRFDTASVSPFLQLLFVHELGHRMLKHDRHTLDPEGEADNFVIDVFKKSKSLISSANPIRRERDIFYQIADAINDTSEVLLHSDVPYSPFTRNATHDYFILRAQRLLQTVAALDLSSARRHEIALQLERIDRIAQVRSKNLVEIRSTLPVREVSWFNDDLIVSHRVNDSDIVGAFVPARVFDQALNNNQQNLVLELTEFKPSGPEALDMSRLLGGLVRWDGRNWVFKESFDRRSLSNLVDKKVSKRFIDPVGENWEIFIDGIKVKEVESAQLQKVSNENCGLVIDKFHTIGILSNEAYFWGTFFNEGVRESSVLVSMDMMSDLYECRIVKKSGSRGSKHAFFSSRNVALISNDNRTEIYYLEDSGVSSKNLAQVEVWSLPADSEPEVVASHPISWANNENEIGGSGRYTFPIVLHDKYRQNLGLNLHFDSIYEYVPGNSQVNLVFHPGGLEAHLNSRGLFAIHGLNGNKVFVQRGTGTSVEQRTRSQHNLPKLR